MGGVLSMTLAARAAAEGLPPFKAVMLANPGRGITGPEVLADFSLIPASTLLLCVSGSDDTSLGVDAPFFFYQATSVPLENKDHVTINSDNHSTPALVADHFAPNCLTAADVNALDTNGYWKWFDGLSAAAWYGRYREYAAGEHAGAALHGPLARRHADRRSDRDGHSLDGPSLTLQTPFVECEPGTAWILDRMCAENLPGKQPVASLQIQSDQEELIDPWPEPRQGPHSPNLFSSRTSPSAALMVEVISKNGKTCVWKVSFMDSVRAAAGRLFKFPGPALLHFSVRAFVSDALVEIELQQIRGGNRSVAEIKLRIDRPNQLQSRGKPDAGAHDQVVGESTPKSTLRMASPWRDVQRPPMGRYRAFSSNCSSGAVRRSAS
jgi:hypothetical protein